MLSGCFSPKFPEGLQCGTGDEPCPPGQICDNGICKTMAGPGIDAPVDPTDRDNDGLTNENDNCPDTFNPGQYDEDFDTLGNPCDPCPFTADNLDTDLDGVGDFCDPNIDIPGDTIVMFEGFDEPLTGDWMLYGNWAQGAGELAFELFNDEFAYATPPVIGDGRGMIVAGFIADVIDPTFVNRGVGVGWLDPNAGMGLACTAIVDPNQGHHLGFIDHTTFQPTTMTPAPWGTGTLEVLFDYQESPDSYYCAISGSVSTGLKTTVSGFLPPATTGLTARSISGRFLWAMYVDVP